MLAFFHICFYTLNPAHFHLRKRMSKSLLIIDCFIKYKTVVFTWQVNMMADLVWYSIFKNFIGACSRVLSPGRGSAPPILVCALYHQCPLTLFPVISLHLPCQCLIIQKDSYPHIHTLVLFAVTLLEWCLNSCPDTTDT